MADAAGRAGVRRFVQVSSMGAGQPPRPGTGEVRAACITAKTAAEADLRARDLDWTIVRPGGLTDAPATGRIRLAPPAGAPWHGAPRRRRRGHYRPARQPGYPAPDPRAGRRRQPGRRGRAQHVLITPPPPTSHPSAHSCRIECVAVTSLLGPEVRFLGEALSVGGYLATATY